MCRRILSVFIIFIFFILDKSTSFYPHSKWCNFLTVDLFRSNCINAIRTTFNGVSIAQYFFPKMFYYYLLTHVLNFYYYRCEWVASWRYSCSLM